MLVVFSVGVAALIWDYNGAYRKNVEEITRKTYGKGKKTEELRVEGKDRVLGKIPIEVTEQVYGEQEISQVLNQETKELLDNYQNLLQELDDLKKFEKYIDLTQKRQELNEVRKRMSQNENIQKYYQSYYKINELLDEVTKIVFKDISDSLDTSGYKL